MKTGSLLLAVALTCMQAPAFAQAREAASSPTLPASLPLRRDAARASEPVPWASAAWILAFTGVAGGWLAWRRLARPRHGAGSPGRPREAVVRLHSQALTPHASVHSVRWNGEVLLVGCTAQAVTVLARRKADLAQEPAA